MLNKQQKSFPLSFNTSFCKKCKFWAQNELSLCCWLKCLCFKAWSQNCSVEAFCFVPLKKNPKKLMCAFVKHIYMTVINTQNSHWIFQSSFFHCPEVLMSFSFFLTAIPPTNCTTSPEVTVIVLAVDWCYLQTCAPILKKNHATSSLYVLQVTPMTLTHQNTQTLKLTVLYL